MINHNIFGERLKDLRIEKNLTQKQLANLTDISKSMISSYEIGESEPTMTKLIALSKFFKVTIDYLCGLED